jgi:hypothetical protein
MQVASPHSRQLVRGSNSHTSSGRGRSAFLIPGLDGFTRLPCLIEEITQRIQEFQSFIHIFHLGDVHGIRQKRDKARLATKHEGARAGCS